MNWQDQNIKSLRWALSHERQVIAEQGKLIEYQRKELTSLADTLWEMRLLLRAFDLRDSRSPVSQSHE